MTVQRRFFVELENTCEQTKEAVQRAPFQRSLDGIIFYEFTMSVQCLFNGIFFSAPQRLFLLIGEVCRWRYLPCFARVCGPILPFRYVGVRRSFIELFKDGGWPTAQTQRHFVSSQNDNTLARYKNTFQGNIDNPYSQGFGCPE